MTNSIKNYEKKYTALEEIVKQLDDENASMHELLETYKKGLTLVKECADILQQVVSIFRYNYDRIFIQNLLTFKDTRLLC